MNWSWIFNMILKVFAVYLAWTCNSNEMFIIRILVSLIALIFTKWYLIYYTGFHWILKYPCATAFGSGFSIS